MNRIYIYIFFSFFVLRNELPVNSIVMQAYEKGLMIAIIPFTSKVPSLSNVKICSSDITLILKFAGLLFV